MSHFAEIQNGIVLRVIVAESLEWCETYLGGSWLQTSYTGSIRKNYAGVGYTYDVERDAFIAPEPEGNLGFDETKCQWIMPEVDINGD
jgi:hypothetical protein